MTREERHKKIVKFLNSLKDEKGKKIFNLIEYKSLRNRGEYNKTLNHKEVNNMAPLICETFGISSGSADDIDFYRLFSSYLLDKDKRERINQVL